MPTNAAPNEQAAQNEAVAQKAAEFRLFAATWHPLDRVPFPNLPPQSANDLQTERSTNRIGGYF